MAQTASDSSPAPAPRPPARSRDPKVMLLAGLLILAVLYTLHYVRQVILPVTIAVLLNFLFSPVVRWLKKRLRFPYAVSAALIILTLIGTIGVTVYRLAQPATAWVSKGPASLRRVEAKLRILKRPVEEVSRTAQRVEQMAGTDDGGVATVQIKEAGLKDAILGNTRSVIVGAALVFTLLFFLLAGGDRFTAKLISVLPRVKDKRLAMAIETDIEQSVSTYLGTTTVINLGLGILTGFAMYVVGLPNPVLWGILGGLLNFIPYVGGLIACVVLALAGMATFESTSRALLPAIVYFGLTNIESFVTPYILGNRLALNPVVVFIAVLFWGWLWGIPGALLAVPIVATFKIICDHIKSMSAIGEFLGK